MLTLSALHLSTASRPRPIQLHIHLLFIAWEKPQRTFYNLKKRHIIMKLVYYTVAEKKRLLVTAHDYETLLLLKQRANKSARGPCVETVVTLFHPN